MTARQSLALLPGLLCDERLWVHQVAALADLAECRVADLTTQVSVAEMARSVLERMPARFALAGLSMGGYVAFEILRQAPTRVSRVALLDTKARLDTPEQTSRRRDLIALAEKGRFKGVTPRLLPLLVHRDRLADQALTDVVVAMAERVGKDGFLRQQKAIMGRPDSLPSLGGITCPTLVLCGREDALTPLEMHQEMADGLPRGRLTVIEACGHLSPLERPDAVSVALRDWLLERAPRS